MICLGLLCFAEMLICLICFAIAIAIAIDIDIDLAIAIAIVIDIAIALLRGTAQSGLGEPPRAALGEPPSENKMKNHDKQGTAKTIDGKYLAFRF